MIPRPTPRCIITVCENPSERPLTVPEVPGTQELSLPLQVVPGPALLLLKFSVAEATTTGVELAIEESKNTVGPPTGPFE